MPCDLLNADVLAEHDENMDADAREDDSNARWHAGEYYENEHDNDHDQEAPSN